MRNGDRLCYDIESTKPDFGGNLCYNGTFNPNIFFDYQAMTDYENYATFVRQIENHGIGEFNQSYGYERSNNFKMIIRSNAESEAILLEQISRIPRFSTDFKPIVI